MLTVEPKGNENILNLMRQAGVLPESPCNGKGLCGKCKVKIVSGTVSPITEQEEKFLTPAEKQENIRLACLAVPCDRVEIDELGLTLEKKSDVLSAGQMPKITYHPSVRVEKKEITLPTLEKMGALVDDLSHRCTLQVMKKLPYFAGKEVYAVLREQTVIDLREDNRIYGLAVDIGTTTVAVSLIDLQTGRAVQEDGFVNPQKAFGLDVLSRIHYDTEHENGVLQMQEVLVKRLQQSIDTMTKNAGSSSDSIYEIVVGGNSTMIHILLGVGLGSLGRSPYSSVFNCPMNIFAEQTGIHINEEGMLYCIPSVSTYIGGDIVAGALAARLDQAEDTVLFIDIGTNGEMILSCKGKMYSCSCAAGPALEGMNISSGMRAEPGAIEKIKIVEGRAELTTIGNAAPRGLCGSGILEAISEAVKAGIIAKTGRIAKDALLTDEDTDGKRRIVLDQSHEIYVTQSDIRQVQLCKGAILSGILTLMQQTGMNADQIDRVIVAGQFGKHIEPQSLTGSGLIPSGMEDKISYIGNSSMTGAKMCLLSEEERERAEEIAGKICYIELSVCEGYEKLFTRCLQFGGI